MVGQGVVAGMSLEAVLTYTMVAAIFADQLSGRTQIDNDLWSGNIANRFLRPMGIYGQMLAEMVGGWIPGLLLFSLPLLLIAPLLGVDSAPATWTAGLWFLLSLALGVAVGTALDLFFAACMVFLEHSVYALQRIRTTLTVLLSGRLIPLALLPWGLGDYFELLPFAVAGIGTTANLHRHGQSTRPHPCTGNLGRGAVGGCARALAPQSRKAGVPWRLTATP